VSDRAPMLVPTNGLPFAEGRQLGLAILGSTGSIGRQTLEVVDRHPDRFRVATLAAGGNRTLLAEQIARYKPRMVALETGYDGDLGTEVHFGVDGLVAAATDDAVDIVIVATSGHAAILPTMRAIEAGKSIALANKETIVCAGELIAALARRHGATIRPIDSEHSAIWQALGRSDGADVERLILTASGGPFRRLSVAELDQVTPDQARAHPTWVMGEKVTIDSATLMNKGLEVIEAHWLFGLPYSQIDVIVHPESIIHSFVEFIDGGQIAQLGEPDMRLPIQFALTYPVHAAAGFRRLRLPSIGTLSFFDPDTDTFPALRLAREAGTAGSTYPTVLSISDEVAVQAFLDGVIGFRDIAVVVERTLSQHHGWPLTDLDALTEADNWGRQTAKAIVRAIAKR
jgi:1-deoxy-D-xylulose-5-phosphate reductoisomerase